MTSTHSQKSIVHDVYQHIAEEYDERIPGTTSLDDRFAATEQRFVLDRVGSSDNVLDIGCGTGRFTVPLAEHAGHVTGFDLSEEMLAQASRKVSAAGLKADFRQGDMASMPFDSGHFNVVVSMMALMHVPTDDRASVFAEAARVLKPGGRLIIGVKNTLFERFSAADRFASIDVTDVENKELILTETRDGDLRAPWYSFSPEELTRLCALSGMLPVGLRSNIPFSAWLSEAFLEEPAVHQCMQLLEEKLADIPPFNHLGYHLLFEAVKPAR